MKSIPRCSANNSDNSRYFMKTLTSIWMSLNNYILSNSSMLRRLFSQFAKLSSFLSMDLWKLDMGILVLEWFAEKELPGN